MDLIGKTCEVCKEGTYGERSIHDDWDGKLTCDKCNHRINKRPNKIKAMKFTPENIRHLEPNQIFTYGANEKFYHGAGAAKLALKWGAKHGMAGLVGQTYGIPTKDKKIQTLPLDKIQRHVHSFLAFAFTHPEYEFLVTKIGCGLANLSIKDIAPMFATVKTGAYNNIILPEEFYKIIYAN